MPATILNIYQKTKKVVIDYMSRRPHRSFRPTRRRDYRRDLKLPGYIVFTKNCAEFLWQNRKVFSLLVVVYLLATVLLIGMASQETYSSLVDTLSSTSDDVLNDFWGRIGGAGLLLIASISGGFLQALSDAQQIYAVIIAIMTALVAIWLSRNIMANRKVNLREALYNAGAPVIPVILIITLVLIQLLPFGLAIIGYTAASSTGLLNGGVEAMLFWIVASLLAGLSLYWIVGSIFALVIVTLPGTSPYRAVRIAGDMVVGRRLKLVLRLVWMLIFVSIVWTLIMVPAILIDMWLKGIFAWLEWLPIVPTLLVLLTGTTVVWTTIYTYTLYRKLVDNETNSSK